MEPSPYAPPKSDLQRRVKRTVDVSTTLLATYFAGAFVVVAVGNHFAIFWGTNGFQYWRLRHYLPASLFFESMLLTLAVILSPIAAWRFSNSLRIDRAGVIGMLLCPLLLVLLAFGILSQTGLPDEKQLVLQSVILVALQVFAVAYNCNRMIGGWRLTAFLTLICGTAGVSASLFHIMINSLIT